MRIYLDSCVFQDLKDPLNNELLALINFDREHNIYCYSEAHIYDLLRDKSNLKYEDADFIEKIVENNCWYYDKKTIFAHRILPADLKSFVDNEDSSDITDIFEDDLFSPMKSFMEITPFNLSELIPQSSLDAYPTELRKVFQNTTNMYEFMQNMLNLSDTLSETQKYFKELVSYLHKNIFVPIYEAMGIKGFGEEGIIDKETFRDAFISYHKKTYPNRNFYEQFIDMYVALELYGFVRGKPRKQKMMNLINDARHAFFGAHCDIVVSKDIDFLNKTQFIYDLFNIYVPVLNIEEFRKYLQSPNKYLCLTDLFEEIDSESIENKITDRIERDDENLTIMKLQNIYMSYFDTFISVTNKNGSYNYMTKEHLNYGNGTLIKEIAYVTKSLISTLGVDAYGKDAFDVSEIDKEGKWCGRVWSFSNLVISLNYDEKLQLIFYPITYLKNENH